MASGLFAHGIAGFIGDGTRNLNYNADTIKASLIDNSYTPDYDTLTVYTNISPDEATAGSPVTLSNKSVGVGTDLAYVDETADTVFSSVTSDSDLRYVMLWDDTDTSGPDIVFLAIQFGTDVVTNGGDITIQWAGTPNYIFSIACQ